MPMLAGIKTNSGIRHGQLQAAVQRPQRNRRRFGMSVAGHIAERFLGYTKKAETGIGWKLRGDLLQLHVHGKRFLA